MKVKFTMGELLALADSYTLDKVSLHPGAWSGTFSFDVLRAFLSRVNWRAGGRWHWFDCDESELRAIHLWARYHDHHHTVDRKVHAVASQILRRSESKRPLGWMRAIVRKTNVGPLNLLDP